MNRTKTNEISAHEPIFEVSKKLIGKPVRKDNKKGKTTLLGILGEKKAYKYANNLKKKILRKLRKHGKKDKGLINSIEFILERKF